MVMMMMMMVVVVVCWFSIERPGVSPYVFTVINKVNIQQCHKYVLGTWDTQQPFHTAAA